MQPNICMASIAPSLFSPEGAVGIIFLVTVAMVFVGAVIATSAKRLVRAVAGLALCFTGVAGIYFFLFSSFLAMMQMLIYVGAVSILIAMAIMLAEPEEKDILGMKGSIFAGPFGMFTGFTVFIGLAVLGYKTGWGCSSNSTVTDIKHMGHLLLTSHSMVFELISIVLLISIIGALVLARKGRN